MRITRRTVKIAVAEEAIHHDERTATDEHRVLVFVSLLVPDVDRQCKQSARPCGFLEQIRAQHVVVETGDQDRGALTKQFGLAAAARRRLCEGNNGVGR